MNRRPLLMLVFAFSCLLALGFNQPVNARQGIDPAVKASTQPDRSVIEEFVSAQVQRLRNAQDPAGQSEARERLVGESGANRSPVTPAYLDLYASVLNEALVPLAEEPTMRVRLNAAIVAARVAQQAENIRLMDAAVAFTADESEPVAIWGLKASQQVIAPMLRLGNPVVIQESELIPGIVEAVRRHDSGPITQEAYVALSLNNLSDQRDAQPAVIRPVLDPMLQTLEQRVERYSARVPPEPRAEEHAVFFLTLSRVWPVQTEEQQLRTVQLLSDLLSLGAQHAVTARQAEREQLAIMLRQTAGALFVVAQQINSPTLQEAVRPATDIDPRMPGDQILQRCEGVYEVIASIPAFSEIEPPPTIQQAAGAR